jgi:pimeloyl-ACP methyl ester carboxylesterase
MVAKKKNRVFEKKEWKDEAGTLPYFTGGEGRALLYLHSGGGPRLSRVLEGLCEGRRVIVPVMPGFDGTPFNDEVRSMRALARLMGEFTDEIIGQDCDVMAQSFGGWVAAWLALERAELVDQLILEAPAGLRPEGKGGLARTPEEVQNQLYVHPENLRPEDASDEDPKVALARLRHYNEEGVHMDEDLAGRLGEIQALTLVLMGVEDTVIPPETGWMLKEKMPRIYLTYIDDAAHNIEVDQPARVLKLVSKFLDHGEAFLLNRGPEAA